jgi:pimeloyl-ACP methyl ester carboxylesterase
MLQLRSDDVRLHYGAKGAGQTMVLQHGFTDRLASWSDVGYVDPLTRKTCQFRSAGAGVETAKGA